MTEEKMPTTESYNKMYAVMKEALDKKEKEEIDKLRGRNTVILKYLQDYETDIRNRAFRIYDTIIQNLYKNNTSLRIEFGDDVSWIKTYAPAIIAAIKEHFPTSEMTINSEPGYDGLYYHMDYEISEADVLLCKDAIEKYQKRLEERADTQKKIESLKRKCDELEKNLLD